MPGSSPRSVSARTRVVGTLVAVQDLLNVRGKATATKFLHNTCNAIGDDDENEASARWENVHVTMCSWCFAMGMGYGVHQTFRRIGFKDEHVFFAITMRCLTSCEEFRLQKKGSRRGAM